MKSYSSPDTTVQMLAPLMRVCISSLTDQEQPQDSPQLAPIRL